METTTPTTFNCHYNQHPPPPTTNLRRQYQNVQFTVPMRNFTLRRITTIPHPLRSNHYQSNLFSLNNNKIVYKTMADESKNMAIQSGNIESISTTSDVGQSNEVSEKSTPTVPPPPEKPLPGDCCGSGCVRCVWDVYFEELEDYDKICKANSVVKPS